MKRIFVFSYFLFEILLLGMPGYLFSQPESFYSIGIGTSTPTLAKLQVNGVSGVGTTSAIFGGDATGISFQRNWPSIGFNQYRDLTAGNGKYIGNGFAAVQHLDPFSGNMYFDMFSYGNANTFTNNGTRVLTIGNTGNIGMKTGAINASLYAIKAGSFDGAAVFGGTSYNSHFCYGPEEDTYIRGGLSSSRVYLNDITGEIILGGGSSFVGINTTSPITTLDVHQVNNKGLILINPNNGFHNWEYHVGYFAHVPESDLKVYYDGVFLGRFDSFFGDYSSISSDRRMKTNIQPMPSVLSKLMLLQPKVYEMRDFNKNHEKTFGFIAQEVNQLYPEFVRVENVEVDSINRIPDLYSLNYDGFDIIAIKALQEQKQQLDILQKENNDLMKRLEELEKKLLKMN